MSKLDYEVEPVGMRILIKRDKEKKESSGGIILPDSAAIPTISALVIKVPEKVSAEVEYAGLRELDRVLYHPKDAIPVSLEGENDFYILPAEDILAILTKKKS